VVAIPLLLVKSVPRAMELIGVMENVFGVLIKKNA
jgi:hypothetical protein